MYVESRLAVCSYREKMYSSIFMPTFFRRRGVRVLHVSMSEWASSGQGTSFRPWGQDILTPIKIPASASIKRIHSSEFLLETFSQVALQYGRSQS